MAEGSAAEAGYPFELAEALGLVTKDEAARAIKDFDEIARMLYKLRCRLSRDVLAR